MDLGSKSALVTGGGSGFGRAVACAHARAGARVVVSHMAGKRAQETVRRAGQADPGADAVFVRADILRSGAA